MQSRKIVDAILEIRIRFLNSATQVCLANASSRAERRNVVVVVVVAIVSKY